jgi:type II secretory pathway predicted ATPase ExeA
MTDREIYRHFGVTMPNGLVRTEAYETMLQHLRDAIEDRDWFAIYGEIGLGKTETVYACLREINLRSDAEMLFIEAFNPERKTYNIGDIYKDLILQAGMETIGTNEPRRDKVFRTRQVMNMVAQARQKKQVLCLILDEAHELHTNTIKQIKRLREMRWNGQINRFPIILIGQPPLRMKVEGDIEIAPRTQVVEFKPTSADLSAIVRHYTCGLLGDEDCVKVVETFKRTHAIRQACRNALRKAAFIGKSDLAFDDFDAPQQEVFIPPTRRRRASASPADVLGFNQVPTGTR